MNSELELYQQQREMVITLRSRQELEVKAWADKMAGLPEHVKETIGINRELTLQALVPALYADPIDEAAYKEQMAEVHKLQAAANAYCSEVNEEARVCLSAFQEQMLKQN